MKVVIGSDHAGYQTKELLKEFLVENKIDFVDVGTNSTESVDYPDFAKAAANKIVNKEVEFGIIICSSGQGVTMAANKIKGIRCGIGYNDKVAELLRNHNNANMIAFGATFMEIEDIKRRTLLFLNAKFEGGRHLRRINKFE